MDNASVLATCSEARLLISKIVPETAAEVRIAYKRRFFRLLDSWLFAGYDIVNQTLLEIMKPADERRLFAYSFSKYSSPYILPNVDRLREFLATDLPIREVPNVAKWQSFRTQVLELAIESERGATWARYNEFRLPAEYDRSLDSDKLRNYYNQRLIQQKKFDQLIPLDDSRQNAVLALRHSARHLLFQTSLEDVILAFQEEHNPPLVVHHLNRHQSAPRDKLVAICATGDAGKTFFFVFYDVLVGNSHRWFYEASCCSNVPRYIMDKLGFSVNWKALSHVFYNPLTTPEIEERYKMPQAYGRFGENLTEEILIDHLLRGFPLFTYKYMPERYLQLLQTENVRRVMSVLGLSDEQFTWLPKDFHLLGSKFNAMMTTVCHLRRCETPLNLVPNELLFQIFTFAM